MAQLLIKIGNAEQIYELKDHTTIGRHPDNTIVLDDVSVSVYHAEILIQEGRFFIKDLNSSNGTKVNGEAIKKSGLKNGASLSIGGIQGTFKNDSEPVEEPAPADSQTGRSPVLIGAGAMALLVLLAFAAIHFFNKGHNPPPESQAPAVHPAPSSSSAVNPAEQPTPKVTRQESTPQPLPSATPSATSSATPPPNPGEEMASPAPSAAVPPPQTLPVPSAAPTATEMTPAPTPAMPATTATPAPAPTATPVPTATPTPAAAPLPMTTPTTMATPSAAPQVSNAANTGKYFISGAFELVEAGQNRTGLNVWVFDAEGNLTAYLLQPLQDKYIVLLTDGTYELKTGSDGKYQLVLNANPPVTGAGVFEPVANNDRSAGFTFSNDVKKWQFLPADKTQFQKMLNAISSTTDFRKNADKPWKVIDPRSPSIFGARK